MTLPAAFFGLLVVAVLSGILKAFMGHSMGQWIVSLAVGLVGLYLGRWGAAGFDLPVYYLLELRGQAFPVVWSVLGASLVLVLLESLRALVFRWRS